MHWSIVRTLVAKELRRLAGHRSALAVIGLLVTGSLILAVFDFDSPARAASRINVFWVDYWQDSPWVEYLRAHVPADLSEHIRFRRVGDIPADRHGTLQYGRGEGAVQIRPADDANPRRVRVWFWYSGDDSSALCRYEEWFWRETYRYARGQAAAVLPTDRRGEIDAVSVPTGSGDAARLAQELYSLYRERLTALAPETVAAVVPEVHVEHSSLHGLAARPAALTGFVLFALFFACALLLPSLTCEEKERGTWLAQALAPVSFAEMISAKAIVFVGLAFTLSVVVMGLCEPTVLAAPFFWLTLGMAGAGVFGLGLAGASLARTQREASTGVLAYTLVVAALSVASQRQGLANWSMPLLEARLPPLFYAVLNDAVTAEHWSALASALPFALAWIGIGVVLFARNTSR